MRSLEIKGTTSTPEINFDLEHSVYRFEGESRPENVEEFYEPILYWLDGLENFIIKNGAPDGSKQEHTFIFAFEYYNSSSGKYLYKIISKIEEIRNRIESSSYIDGDMAPIQINIEWHYYADDDFIKEAGEEMQDATEIEIQTKLIPNE